LKSTQSSKEKIDAEAADDDVCMPVSASAVPVWSSRVETSAGCASPCGSFSSSWLRNCENEKVVREGRDNKGVAARGEESLVFGALGGDGGTGGEVLIMMMTKPRIHRLLNC
jgi:hypothetical protein